MAITKIMPVRKRLDHLLAYVANTAKTENPDYASLEATLDYVANPDKTEQRFFVTGINCLPQTAYTEMQAALGLNDKPVRVQCYHIIQSFAPGEVDAATAHEVGVKLAWRLWGADFQSVVATHLNTGIFHNHIALCSTSCIDGHRYHSCKDGYKEIREESDRLCAEYGLSIIKDPEQHKGKNYGQVRAEREGRPTWHSAIKSDIDECIAKAKTEAQFFENLTTLGYEYKLGADVLVRPPGKERYFRLERNLGAEHSKDSIHARLKATPTDTTSCRCPSIATPTSSHPRSCLGLPEAQFSPCTATSSI
jgi:hypothetical protein